MSQKIETEKLSRGSRWGSFRNTVGLSRWEKRKAQATPKEYIAEKLVRTNGVQTVEISEDLYGHYRAYNTTDKPYGIECLSCWFDLNRVKKEATRWLVKQQKEGTK